MSNKVENVGNTHLSSTEFEVMQRSWTGSVIDSTNQIVTKTGVQGGHTSGKTDGLLELLEVENELSIPMNREAARAKDVTDVVLPAAIDDEESYVPAPSAKKYYSKPQLPAGSPGTSSGSSLADPENISIIAIIGEVLALQAKTNSNFCLTAWQQASMSMNLAVQLAPVIRTAVEQNWNSQAEATQQDANIAKNSGWFAISSGAFAMLMGAKSAYDAAQEDAAKAVGTTNTTDALKQGAQEAQAQMQDDISKLPQNDETLTGRLSRAWKGLSGSGSKAMGGLFKALNSAASFGQFSMALSNGIAQVTVEAPGNAAKAIAQRQAGSADALSKVAEQYSQYYTQDFNRTEDMRQNSNQLLTTCTEILRNASDTVTQVTRSMFQG